MFARRRFVAMAALIAFTGPAVAGDWPDKPVRIIYPYAAGSTGAKMWFLIEEKSAAAC